MAGGTLNPVVAASGHCCLLFRALERVTYHTEARPCVASLGAWTYGDSSPRGDFDFILIFSPSPGAPMPSNRNLVPPLPNPVPNPQTPPTPVPKGVQPLRWVRTTDCQLNSSSPNSTNQRPSPLPVGPAPGGGCWRRTTRWCRCPSASVRRRSATSCGTSCRTPPRATPQLGRWTAGWAGRRGGSTVPCANPFPSMKPCR